MVGVRFNSPYRSFLPPPIPPNDQMDMHDISIPAPQRNSALKDPAQATTSEYAARHIAEKFAIANLSLAARISTLAGLGEPEARS